MSRIAPLTEERQAEVVAWLVELADFFAEEGAPELLDVVTDRAAALATAQAAWLTLESAELDSETMTAKFSRTKFERVVGDVCALYGADVPQVARAAEYAVGVFVNSIEPKELARVLGQGPR